MERIKPLKSLPADSRTSLEESYLDEFPDIDLIQKDPVEEPPAQDEPSDLPLKQRLQAARH